MAPGIHRVEISANNRSGCKNKECKDAKIKIFKGQMRYGTWFDGPNFSSWSWKHWGCVTPRQIQNLRETVENDASNLDGYEDLPGDMQEKIEKAIEEGHVADEDWGGDVEMNRAGKNGYRTLESKRAKREEAQALKAEGSASPNNSPGKKRSHVKDDSDADVKENESVSKKRKAAVKKEKKVKEEEVVGEYGDDTRPIKEGRKKATKAKAKVNPAIKEEGGDEDYLPVKKTRVPRKAAATNKVKDEQIDSDAPDDVPEAANLPPAKKARAPRKSTAAKKIKDEETDDGNMLNDLPDTATPPPARKARVLRKTAPTEKTKIEETDINALNDASEPSAPVPVPKTKATRKAAAAKNVKTEDPDTDMLTEIPAEQSPGMQETFSKVKIEQGSQLEADSETESKEGEAAPASKRGVKKVSKKAVNSTATGAVGKCTAGPQQMKAPREAEKPKRANGRVTRSHSG